MHNVWVLTPIGHIKPVTEARAAELADKGGKGDGLTSFQKMGYANYIFFFAELSMEEF